MLQRLLLILAALTCGVLLVSPCHDAAAQEAGQAEVAATDAKEKKPDVIYVPTPQDVVDLMLALGNVKSTDLLYDLGCGDGRIVVTAAKRYGCKSVGVDIDPQRIQESRANVQAANVGDLVTIERNDIFTIDLSGADVVMLYLLPELNVRLLPQLEKMKPGSRIVSHSFDIEGMVPDAKVTITGRERQSEDIYLWTIPFVKAPQTNPQAVYAPLDQLEERSFASAALSMIYKNIPLLVTIAALLLAGSLWLLRNRLGEVRVDVTVDKPNRPN